LALLTLVIAVHRQYRAAMQEAKFSSVLKTKEPLALDITGLLTGELVRLAMTS
jgi:hypothetical protein